MCEDFGSSSFLMGAITGMVASWVVIIYLSVIKKEDR
jgi:hypothetical protein